MNMKKLYKNPLLILILGLVVISAGSITATRAAMVYQSAAERVNFSTAEISVEIKELVDNGYVTVDKQKGLSFPEVAKDQNFKIGKKYPESVKLVNNSKEETGYSEYVRVVLRKSWFKGGKNTDLDPSLINIEVADGWYKNEAESTPEQSVYYMLTPLGCGKEVEFVKSISVDNKVTNLITQKETETSIETEYLYSGESLFVQIQADAVQTHNAEDAIYAAWGVKAKCDTADDGKIISISGVNTQ